MEQRNHGGSSGAASAADPYETFLSRLGQKALAAVEKHVELCEADAAHGYGRWWKRLAGTLGALAPFAIETAGHQALKFHIPDGKYRQQVFALEDGGQGRVFVYLPDIVALAVSRNLFKGPTGEGHTYAVVGEPGTQLDLELISSDSKDAPPFCKPMLGWGRRAIRTSVSVIADEKQVRALEKLCALAAETWADKATAPAAE